MSKDSLESYLDKKHKSDKFDYENKNVRDEIINCIISAGSLY